MMKKDWIEHHGGDCPAEVGTLVDVKFRDGVMAFRQMARVSCMDSDTRTAAEVFWHKTKGHECSDIVAWRKSATVGELLQEKIDSMPGAQRKQEIDKTYKDATITQDSSFVVKGVNPKHNLGLNSLPLNLFSPLATAYGCIGKLNGKLKYGLNNFSNTPVIASIYVDAIRRHLDKWMSGQEVDAADGVPHFSAILANVDILLSARAAGTLIDDRPSSAGYFEEVEKLIPLVKSLQELHKDKNPKHYYLKAQE